MSCINCRIVDAKSEKICLDFKYPHNCYKTIYHAPTIRSPCSEICKNSRGDSPFPDATIQIGRTANARIYEAARHRDSTSATTISTEKMHIKMKYLEDSNATLHLRNQTVIAENKGLVRRLEEDAIKIDKLQENVLLLQQKLNNECAKLAELLTKQTKNNEDRLEDKYTSTNIVPKTDHVIQVWEACKNCQSELEGCQKEPPTIIITKSELELLEKDMQTLKDAVVAREEAWAKAMEREQNCRHQLARLTAEAITARHLCEVHQNELRMTTDILEEREFELKTIQKETLYLNKLIAKLHRHQKDPKEYMGGNINFSISEKDQKYIEEIVQRIRPVKSKSKAKSKWTSEKHSYSNSSSRHGSPRDGKNICGKDQAGS